MGDAPTPLEIRPYRPADRPSVRDICVACAWMGEPAPERIGDEFLWAEYWTRYFTDREPQHTWVVSSQDGSVVGYLAGTVDVRRVERFTPWLFPSIACRVVRGRLLRRQASRRAILALVRSAVSGELALPPGVLPDHAATFHFNLLPVARGRGVGSRLLATFRAKMGRLGSRGLHLQILSANVAAARFCRRNGLRLLAARETRAFLHVDPQPIEVETWTLGLHTRRAVANGARP